MKEEEKQRKRYEREEKYRDKLKEEYNKKKAALIEGLGQPDKTIAIKELDVEKEIVVFGNSQLVFILGQKYQFKDIISCVCSDDTKTIKGEVSAITNTNTGSAIGRGIVGAVIAGPAGAIIGGSTASTNTEYHQESDTIVHNYTVNINVNSLSNPITSIYTGSNAKLANEIVGLMNVIISRNKAN